MVDPNITNILTIDIEDWYIDIDIRYWEDFEGRVIQNIDKVLDIQDEHS